MSVESTIQRLVQVADQLQNESSQSVREQLEAEARCLAKENDFLSSIFTILADPSCPDDRRLIFLILLKEEAKRVDSYPEAKAVDFVTRLVQLMNLPIIGSSIRDRLTDVLETALSFPASRVHLGSVSSMRQVIMKGISEFNAAHVPNRLTLACLLLSIRALINSTSDIYVMKQILSLSGFLCQLFDSCLARELENLGGTAFSKATIGQPEVQAEVEAVLDLVLQFSITFNGFSNKLKKYGETRATKPEELGHRLKVVIGLLSFRIGNLAHNPTNLLFEPTGFPELNLRLRQIQIKALRSLSDIFKIYKTLSSDREQDSGLKSIETSIRSFCRSTLEALYAFFTSSSEASDLIVKVKKLDSQVRYAMVFLSACSEQLAFFELFESARRALIAAVVVPALAATPQEVLSMTENPGEFISYTTDLLDFQKSGTTKVASAVFLRNVCDNIDGSVSFAFELFVELVRSSLTDGPVSNLPAQSSALLQSPTARASPFLQQSAAVRRAEVGLIGLSLMHGFVKAREDLCLQLKAFISGDISGLLQKHIGSELIQCRVMSFMTKYVWLVDDREEAETQSTSPRGLELMNMMLASVKGSSALSRTAVKCLFSLLKFSTASKTLFSSIFDNLLVALLVALPNSESLDLLVLIRMLIVKHGTQLSGKPQLAVQLVRGVVERICSETQSPSTNVRSALSELFGLLQVLCNSESLAKEFFQLIDEGLAPLLGMLELKESFNWTSELLDLYIDLSSHAKRVSALSDKLFWACPRVQASQNGHLTQVFLLLNRMIIYESASFNGDKLKAIIEMAKTCLEQTSKARNSDYYHCDAFLLLQVLVQIAWPLFRQSDIAEVVGVFNTHFQRVADKDAFSAGIIVDKVVGLMLSLILRFGDSILPEMAGTGRLAPFLAFVKLHLGSFETKYETKLLLLSMIRTLGYLLQEAGPASLKLATDLLDWLVPFMKLNQLQCIATGLNRIRTMRELSESENRYFEIYQELQDYFPELTFHGESLSDPKFLDEQVTIEEMLEAEESHYNEKNQMVSRVISPINDEDEYVRMGELVNGLLAAKPEVLQLVTQSLSSMAARFMKEVAFKIRYISVGSKGQTTLALRKVVKIKTA